MGKWGNSVEEDDGEDLGSLGEPWLAWKSLG